MKYNLPLILKFISGAGVVIMHFILVLLKIPVPPEFLIIEVSVLTWLGVMNKPVTTTQSQETPPQ
jgi:hypothetical protein